MAGGRAGRDRKSGFGDCGARRCGDNTQGVVGPPGRRGLWLTVRDGGEAPPSRALPPPSPKSQAEQAAGRAHRGPGSHGGRRRARAARRHKNGRLRRPGVGRLRERGGRACSPTPISGPQSRPSDRLPCCGGRKRRTCCAILPRGNSRCNAFRLPPSLQPECNTTGPPRVPQRADHPNAGRAHSLAPLRRRCARRLRSEDSAPTPCSRASGPRCSARKAGPPRRGRSVVARARVGGPGRPSNSSHTPSSVRALRTPVEASTDVD